MENNIDFSKIYSYSKLELFNKCPKQYFFNYLDPEITPIKKEFKEQKDYQTKGTAVHGAITLFHYLAPEKRTFKNLKDCLAKAWFSENKPLQSPPLGKWGGFKSLEHERKVYKDCLILLRNFIKKGNIKPTIFYLPTNNIKNSFDDYQSLIKPLNKDVSISGKFDRIDKVNNNSLKIIDYKTGGRNNNEFQLYFYKLLAEVNFKNKVSSVGFYYLNFGKSKEFDVLNVDNEKIKDKILKTVKRIKKTQKFLPKASPICNYCDFKEVCPAHKTSKEIKNKIKEVKNRALKRKLS